MKFLTAALLSVFGVNCFAAHRTIPKTATKPADATYSCTGRTGAFELKQHANPREDDTVYGQEFGDTPKALRSMAPEDYSVEVPSGNILYDISEAGDGDTQYYYLIVPDASLHNPATMVVTTVFDDQRVAHRQPLYSNYLCTKQ